ncbi:helix-turn-helix transcriptional regulator [Bradyrhizobium sp. CCBAU 51753]|uniref:helix-turn-helix transcriptional regulator n=1 Tax=Bradyrhizobium sp. CCBAU 51753 TaxID=1325100 RepID=UPI00188D74B6|nr:helix-turn-helix transcriptional regulator [Bradyrhizobium sp. CCBAU 51753]QOZ23011.1 LuxR family transcriptional regulator [Bradyrhizobium sp. CCBAU 51753]
MKAARAFTPDVVSDITPALLAIGRDSFPQALIGTLRRVADVGHCMVFSFAGPRSAACLLDVGNIPTGRDLGIAYSEHFHQADPNRDAVFEGQAQAAPIVLPNFARRMYSDGYRKIFFDDSDIVDKFASAIWTGDTCFYVNFYRITEQGRFTREQIARLTAVAPAVSAAVARHFQYDEAPDRDPMARLKTLFATAEPLARLTAREKEVCLRILSGFSSEAIAAELGIGLHSALTYRKRAYDKLGISSQNQLFAIALRLVASSRPLN